MLGSCSVRSDHELRFVSLNNRRRPTALGRASAAGVKLSAGLVSDAGFGCIGCVGRSVAGGVVGLAENSS